MTEIRSRIVDVLGSRMHYRATGRGARVVLLHGNPTSSWLWRHVLHPALGDDSQLTPAKQEDFRAFLVEPLRRARRLLHERTGISASLAG